MNENHEKLMGDLEVLKLEQILTVFGIVVDIERRRVMNEKDDIQAVANHLVIDMFAELETKHTGPTDDMIESAVDGFCKSKDWHTPKRAVLYQKVMGDLDARYDNDKSIDVDACAVEIFGNMDQIQDVQYDGIESAVEDYLIDELYSFRHFDMLHKRVIWHVERALSSYPNNKGDQSDG